MKSSSLDQYHSAQPHWLNANTQPQSLHRPLAEKYQDRTRKQKALWQVEMRIPVTLDDHDYINPWNTSYDASPPISQPKAVPTSGRSRVTMFKATSDSDSQQAAPRTRNRKVNTCIECRRLKRKCSRTQPCTNCEKTQRLCYFPPQTPGSSTLAPGHSSTPFSQLSSNDQSSTQESPPLIKGDYANPRKPPDMCLRIGRLSITERIGGQLRANAAQVLEVVLRQRSYEFDQIDSYSAPIVAWFKPHSILPVGQLLSPNIPTTESEFFCSDVQQQALIDRFFVAVHPVCHVVTRFELQGSDPLTMALRSAVFFASSASMGLYQCQKLFNMTRETLMRKLKISAEIALSRAELFSCMDIKVFQALVVYLTPQMMAEVSRSYSLFVALIVRHFQIAGFDQDAAQDSELEKQTKRHLWHHLLFLNVRAVEAVGPERTLIDDPDSPLPVVNSDSSMVAVIRYECYRIHRFIFAEREKVNAGTLPWAGLLTIVEQKTASIRARYLNLLDDSIPLQKYARLVGDLLLSRCETMVLIAFQHKWKNTLQVDELRTRGIRGSLGVSETGAILDTDPDIAHWAWYNLAYHQYHSVLTLMIDLYQNPDLPEAGRISAILDHIFGQSSAPTPQMRCGQILRAVRDNLASFLTAIGSVDPQSSLYDRSVPHPAICEADQGLPTNFAEPFDTSNLTDQALQESEIWWLWQPEMQYLDQQSLDVLHSQ